MALGDWKATEGKQRAVWAQPGGQVVSEGQLVPVHVVIIESGVALIEDFILIDNVLSRWDVRIPIIDLPGSVKVAKTVAAAWPASFGSSEDAEEFGWAVDTVEVEIEPNSNLVTLVVHAAALGEDSRTLRFGYHITIFLNGERLLADPEVLNELDRA